MRQYSVNPIEICYDKNRTTGRYYALVIFKELNDKNPLTKPPKNIGKLEVTLNGPGITKARKRVAKGLLAKGIDLSLVSLDFKPFEK